MFTLISVIKGEQKFNTTTCNGKIKFLIECVTSLFKMMQRPDEKSYEV